MIRADLDANAAPDVPPTHDVACQQLFEVAGDVGGPVLGLLPRLADAVVAGGEQGDDLLDGDLVAGCRRRGRTAAR